MREAPAWAGPATCAICLTIRLYRVAKISRTWTEARDISPIFFHADDTKAAPLLAKLLASD